MGYLLLWIENLAVSLLFMAFVMACVGRWRRRWLRTAVWLPIALFLLMPYSFAALCIGGVKFSACPDFPWFYYAATLALGVFVGAIVLRVIALKRTANPEYPTAAARWPRGKLFAFWCVVLALHWATFQNMDNAAVAQLKKLQQRDKPPQYANISTSVADSENAVPLYQKAAEAVPFLYWDGNGRHEWLDSMATAQFDSKNPELIRFMQENESVARLLHAAVQRPFCVFHPDPDEPGRSVVPFRDAMGALSKFMTLHCRCKLAEGDRQAAWRDVQTLFCVTHHFMGKNEWGSVSGASIEKQAIRSLQYALLSAQPTTEELAPIQLDEFFSWRMTEYYSFPLGNRWYLDLLAQFSLDNPERSPQDYGLHLPSFIANNAWYRIFFFPIDEAVYRRVASETQGRLRWPYFDAAKFPLEDAKSLRNPMNFGALVTDSSHIAQYYLMLPKTCARADARHATAVAALAAARYQAKFGQLPEQLENLVPEFLTVAPQDPFDGEPIKYQKSDSGMTIFSVGRDVVDEDDISRSSSSHAKETEKNDMRFDLPRWNP
jgi:hypothetical protein